MYFYVFGAAEASKAAMRRAAAELPEQALGSPRGGEVTPTSIIINR